MPNRITKVTIPPSVRGGVEFKINIEYTADDDGDLRISYPGTFDGHPDSEPLSATEPSKSFPVTIVRYGTSPHCRIELRFGNQWVGLVEVT